MDDHSTKKYGFMVLDEESHIRESKSHGSYEDTLDAKLLANENNWTYVPIDLGSLVDELSKISIYESDGAKYSFSYRCES